MCSAPTTFFTLMNNLFRPFLDKSVVVYLDDIVVFNENMEDHNKHLAEVFEALRQNQLYLKKSKSVFGQTKNSFLGHWIGQGCIHMNLAKITTIEDWEEPRTIHEVKNFLSLANYYHRFVEGYSKISAPLSDLLKKNKPWKWTKKYQTTFYGLKWKLVSAHVLKLPNFEQSFEVQTDASDFSIGGVLSWEAHPVAYESRKLQDHEQRYSIHEKQMITVVHFL